VIIVAIYMIAFGSCNTNMATNGGAALLAAEPSASAANSVPSIASTASGVQPVPPNTMPLQTSPNPTDSPPSTASPEPPTDDTKSPQVKDQPFLHDYQTIIVGSFTFVIGIFTVINAFINTIIARRTRQREERLKRRAFLTIMERDVSHIAEQLQTAKEIISSIEPGVGPREFQSATGWIASIRIASRISALRSFEQEWEKLYMVGAENISRLRDFDIALREIGASFQDLISQPDALRGHVTPVLPGIVGDDEQEQMMATLTSLEEQIDSAIRLSEELIHSVRLEFGERNGGVEIPKERQASICNLAKLKSCSAKNASSALANN
jgi:hypothetical protein